tara:strand:- start:84 stop:341 length:258 start_codon:yes stop_codon:yes gene_type:complete
MDKKDEEISDLKKKLAEAERKYIDATAKGETALETQNLRTQLEQAKKDLEARPPATDATTLKVVNFDRDIHSGLPKGTILGVLES